jgi:hypothetical protein
VDSADGVLGVLLGAPQAPGEAVPGANCADALIDPYQLLSALSDFAYKTDYGCVWLLFSSRRLSQKLELVQSTYCFDP